MKVDKPFLNITLSREFNDCFWDSLYCGDCEYSELVEFFEAIKKTKYSRKERITVIKNIITVSRHVPIERTDYHTLSGEALLYLADSFKIEGSVNLKIVYALFLSCVTYKKHKDNKTGHYEYDISTPIEVNIEINERLYTLSNNDKRKAITIAIEKICKKLMFPYTEKTLDTQ